MAGTEVITVSMRELDRLKTVQAVVDGQLRPGVAAERLEITDRQFRRLLERYKQEGPSGLVSRRRGRPSNNRMPADRESVALGLIREHYADFGPTLAAEKLRERHGLTLSKETIRRLMTAAGLWVPRKQRPPKVYQPRNRRACYGELIQIDGSDHRWFEERAPACTLLVYVDDATSRIMELRFTHSESTFTYFAATRAYLERHGKPVAFYSDKASVFRVNKQGATGGDGHTQFARALFELNIEGICANSSQAKGRVERTHLTLQDRLVKELRLRGISTMQAANAFMAEFIADYNARFAKLPRNNHNAHRPLRPDENLDLIFAWREPRCVSKSLTIQYDKMLYLLTDTPEHRKLAGRYIDVYHYPDGRIEPRANGTALPYTIYDKLSEVDQGAIVDNKRLGHVLQLAQYVQEKRDNTRSLSVPATEGIARKRGRPPGKKSQRSLDQNDMLEALKRLQQQPWPLNGTDN
ncbi:ISNCY family transposase [Cupriavidus sp. L7L]|uniref:ISNCY family transposase n=1 Tax=Cupriavidus sp. L7L TaxID=2546443 RepID=UPI0010568EE7|nr:ISNCY family transposase [Cupriavidus sp. L7L]TDF66967.1 ISNCY family transposase [Cupriavidus sp. L7L]